MSTTEIPGFARSLHQTHVWLRDICEALDDPRRQMAYHALRGVLFALRDRLPVGEVFDLSAQLPLLIRGIFFEAYRPENKPESFNRDAFLNRVRSELQVAGGGNPEQATRAVLDVLQYHIADGEIDQIRRALPASIRKLWPQPEAQTRQRRQRRSSQRKRPSRTASPSTSPSDAESHEEYDEVDEAGFESFPASDAPAW